MSKLSVMISEANLEMAQIQQEITDLETERANAKARIKMLEARKQKIIVGLNRLKLEVEKSREEQVVKAPESEVKT